MGGLKKYLPVTYWTALIGSLALIGFPGTSGFFSKDALIEAVHASHIPGATYAYWCVFLGVFVTAFYSFRLVFMTFHGPEKFHGAGHDTHAHAHPQPHVEHGTLATHAEPASHAHDSHAHDTHAGHDTHDHHAHDGPPKEAFWSIKLPLILLAIPSLVIGALTIGPVLFGGYFQTAIFVLPQHDTVGHVGEEYHGVLGFLVHAFKGQVVYMALLGVLAAWFLYIKRPDLPAVIAGKLSPLYKLLAAKFYFDEFNQFVFGRGSVGLGKALWRVGDVVMIDGLAVNGSARVVGWLSGIMRRLQSGYLYHYAFAMIIGLSALIGWYVLR
jgi:NADH-quinone oxidoreductase subunit L